MKNFDDENENNTGSDAEAPLTDDSGNVDTDKVQDVASDEADKVEDAQAPEPSDA